MATRGSALGKTIAFFRNTELDVARVTFQLISEVMDERLSVAATPEPAVAKVRRSRTRKAKASETATAAVREGESLASA